MKKKNIVILSLIIFAVLVTSACVLVAMFNSSKQVYRIASYRDKVVTVEVWKDNYWEQPLETKKINGTNYESKVGDLVNKDLEFVDTDGNVLESRPEAKQDVYTITGVEPGAIRDWVVVNGPLTYEAGQGTTTIIITDPNLKIGSYIDKDGFPVDMYGYGIKY